MNGYDSYLAKIMEYQETDWEEKEQEREDRLDHLANIAFEER